MAKRRHNKDLPRKTAPAEFGGGRSRGFYLDREIRILLCSRAGCGRKAYATWGACSDASIQRPLCPECDVMLNYLVLQFMRDPNITGKMTDYTEYVESRAGRDLLDDTREDCTRNAEICKEIV